VPRHLHPALRDEISIAKRKRDISDAEGIGQLVRPLLGRRFMTVSFSIYMKPIPGLQSYRNDIFDLLFSIFTFNVELAEYIKSDLKQFPISKNAIDDVETFSENSKSISLHRKRVSDIVTANCFNKCGMHVISSNFDRFLWNLIYIVITYLLAARASMLSKVLITSKSASSVSIFTTLFLTWMSQNQTRKSWQ
jgi:hypothetical protein